MIQEGIHKGVYSWIEQNHHVNNSYLNKADFERCEKSQNVFDWFGSPTNCKDETDRYDHQSDAFSNPQHTLEIEKRNKHTIQQMAFYKIVI